MSNPYQSPTSTTAPPPILTSRQEPLLLQAARVCVWLPFAIIVVNWVARQTLLSAESGRLGRQVFAGFSWFALLSYVLAFGLSIICLGTGIRRRMARMIIYSAVGFLLNGGLLVLIGSAIAERR